MKYLFLDIDGVLNYGYGIIKDRTPNGWLGLCDEKIKILKTLIDKVHPKVVLSSSWRKISDGDLEWLHDRLKKYNILIDDYTTNEFPEDRRDLQIIEYLIKNLKDNDQFVIVDDSFLDEFITSGLQKHFVQTEWKYGLTSENVQLAIGILKSSIKYKIPTKDEFKLMISRELKGYHDFRFGDEKFNKS